MRVSSATSPAAVILGVILGASSLTLTTMPANGADNSLSSLCGDTNGDDRVDIGDAIHLLQWLFSGGPAPTCPRLACADFNGDENIDISDPVGLLVWLFRGAAGPDPRCGDGWPLRARHAAARPGASRSRPAGAAPGRLRHQALDGARTQIGFVYVL